MVGSGPIAMPIRAAADIEPALASFAGAPNGGLMLLGDSFTRLHGKLIADLAGRFRLRRPDRVSAIGRSPGAVRGHATGPRFLGAFPQMHVAIDDLQVWYAPEAKQ
jgi:hypothetical protein